jgi:hypothetical protein
MNGLRTSCRQAGARMMKSELIAGIKKEKLKVKKLESKNTL